MDKVTVVDGNSIHKLEDRAENGRGKDKMQALFLISQLQSKIQNDFKAVTGFALHQEHILEVVLMAGMWWDWQVLCLFRPPAV